MNYSYNFNEKQKSKKKKIIFLIVFILILIFIVSYAFKSSENKFINTVSNIVILPVKYISNGVNHISDNINNYFVNGKKISSENESLKEKLKEAELKLLENQKILLENKSLKESLKINNSYSHFELKHAKVILRNHDNWTQTFNINLGSNDGIKVDQAVVHENGLVGIITKVNETTSTVVTILDPIISVSVSISTANEPAILKGDVELKSKNELKLTYIPIGAEVSVGDILYTSGLGSSYPIGIPVGEVTQVINKKNDIDRYAIVKTNVNIRTISEVGIIIN